MVIRAIALCLALSAIAMVRPAVAQLALTTVRGEVVSVECALTRGDAGRGDAHGPCAMECARRGDPMGILADDGIYLIVGDYAAHANARLLDFVAKRVEAKGTIAEDGGRKTISIAAMMVWKDTAPPAAAPPAPAR